MIRFSIDDLVKEAERELALRRRVYPLNISRCRMSQETADRQTAMQEAIIEMLRSLRPAIVKIGEQVANADSGSGFSRIQNRHLRG